MQQLVILLVITCSSTCFWTIASCVHTTCIQTLQHHNSYNRTENHRQWNAVWPPHDGRKDARNMLRNNWLPIKSLIVASSWSRLYLQILKKKLINVHKLHSNHQTPYIPKNITHLVTLATVCPLMPSFLLCLTFGVHKNVYYLKRRLIIYTFTRCNSDYEVKKWDRLNM